MNVRFTFPMIYIKSKNKVKLCLIIPKAWVSKLCSLSQAAQYTVCIEERFAISPTIETHRLCIRNSWRFYSEIY